LSFSLLNSLFVYAKVFVVDSSDSSYLNEAAQCLSNVLRNPTLSGLPLLVLANKQDLDDAKDVNEVTMVAKLFF
jgi:ADP-ribosylation factor-like protein 13B